MKAITLLLLRNIINNRKAMKINSVLPLDCVNLQET